MSKKTLKEYERELTATQLQVANAYVANEYKPKNEQATITDMCIEHGISRQTFYEWKKNGIFVGYMSALSERKLDSVKSQVDAQLMKLISGAYSGTPSIKAIDLYYKLRGHLVDRQLIATEEAGLQPRLSEAEITAELDDLNKLLGGK